MLGGGSALAVELALKPAASSKTHAYMVPPTSENASPTIVSTAPPLPSLFQGWGFKVQDSGFRVQGSGCRDQGAELRRHASHRGLSVEDFVFGFVGFGRGISGEGLECRVHLDFGLGSGVQGLRGFG